LTNIFSYKISDYKRLEPGVSLARFFLFSFVPTMWTGL